MIAIGAAIALCASLAHEALGHGMGCVADGGTITLLTFLVFRCAGAGVSTDWGGPAGTLLVACLALIAASRTAPRSSRAGLFAYALGIQMMFWLCAQMVREGLDGSDDWGHVARDLNWPAGWHAVVSMTGAIGYCATIRLAAALGGRHARGRPLRLLIPYAATCLCAVVFGALWHGGRVESALDGFMSFGVAPLGYLLVISAIAREEVPADDPRIRRSYVWIMAVAVVACVFMSTVGRGLGKLA